uniref:Uncharacterized protein n=1 Tax=Vitis vinifera TaxID=29760 RepID=F6HQV4_VITVI
MRLGGRGMARTKDEPLAFHFPSYLLSQLGG